MFLLPIATGVLCCSVISRISDPEYLLDLTERSLSHAQESLPEIDESEIETYQIEQYGDVIELGLLLTKVAVRQQSDGTTTFEARIINFGPYPVEHPWVRLQLYDNDQKLAELVELRGD